MRNKKGFTLAELLIVVAIIAVLVAIMIPVFGKSRAEAVLAKDVANLRSIYAEAVTNEMATDTAAVTINIDKAIENSGITFDDNTVATYTAPDPAGTNNGKIVVSASSGTTKTHDIVIDRDVTLNKEGGSAYTTGDEIDLNNTP